MSNVAGKSYAITVVTPMRPWLTWINRAAYLATRALPFTLKGVLGLSFIHFGRWVIVKRRQWPDLGQGKPELRNDYMLFCSNFNGSWDQYLDAFSDGIPNGVDLYWISSTKFPHSIPISPFKAYISANQIDTQYYYNATPGASQRDIKAALRVRRAVQALAKQHKSLTPADFQKDYVKALCSVQNDLGCHGYAAAASEDTERAERNLARYAARQTEASAEPV